MYTNDASRIEAVYAINRCIEKIKLIPIEFLDLYSKRLTLVFLNMLKDEIYRESRENYTGD